MYDNSFIFFTADHGDMLGDHYHWRKTYAYEGSANIPMLMKWPRDLETYVEKGSEMKQVTELRDILPTLLDITGQKIPDEMDGDSLLKLITEKNPKWREWVDLEHSTCYHKRNYWMALTDGKMKYIYFRSTGNEQLFNLKKDPGEIHDLADDPDYEEELEKWRSRMIDHLSERGKGWVKDGKLQTSKKGMLYGPNYPDYKESFFQKILRKIRGY